MKTFILVYFWILRVISIYVISFWSLSIIGIITGNNIGNQADYGFFLYSLTLVIPLIIIYAVTIFYFRKRESIRLIWDKRVLALLIIVEVVLGFLLLV